MTLQSRDQDKPRAQIGNWYFDGVRLWGDIRKHPRIHPRYSHTSTVLQWGGHEGWVETRNTIYRLGPRAQAGMLVLPARK